MNVLRVETENDPVQVMYYLVEKAEIYAETKIEKLTDFVEGGFLAEFNARDFLSELAPLL